MLRIGPLSVEEIYPMENNNFESINALDGVYNGNICCSEEKLSNEKYDRGEIVMQEKNSVLYSVGYNVVYSVVYSVI